MPEGYSLDPGFDQNAVQENEKYLRGIQDLTALREAEPYKVWARDARSFTLVCREFGKSSQPK